MTTEGQRQLFSLLRTGGAMSAAPQHFLNLSDQKDISVTLRYRRNHVRCTIGSAEADYHADGASLEVASDADVEHLVGL